MNRRADHIMVVFACYNERFWSGNNPDRFWMVVDIFRPDGHRNYHDGMYGSVDTYFCSSMEG